MPCYNKQSMIQQDHKTIVEKLLRTSKKSNWRQAIEGALFLVSILVSALILLWFITLAFWPGPLFRTALTALLLLSFGYILFKRVIRPLVKKPALAEIAIRLEKHYGLLQSRLIGALQLYDKLRDNKENYSLELIEKTIEEAGQQIRDMDFSVAVVKNGRPLRIFLGAIALLIVISIVSFDTVGQTLKLYSNPLAEIPRPTNLRLSISPELAEVIKNENLTVKITAEGERINRPQFRYRFGDESWAEAPPEEIVSDSTNFGSSFIYTFKKLRRDAEFYAAAGSVKSSTGKIRVIDPPRIVDLSVTLDYPDYTGLSDQELPQNEGSVTALKGTEVRIKARANKPIKNGHLVFSDSSGAESRKQILEIAGNSIIGKFKLSGFGAYKIVISDSSGLTNPSPISYDIVALEDYPPSVNITFPASDIDLDERMFVPLEAELHDDFGFSQLDLVYWVLSEGRESDRRSITLTRNFKGQSEAVVEYDWSVEELNLMPGDLVYYFLEVYDNDAVSGAKAGQSKTYSARLPSLDEIVADITGSREDIIEQMQQASATQKKLKEQLENIAREMQTANEVNYEKKSEIQSVVNRQKEIAEKIEKAARQLAENIEKLDKQQMAAQEMLDKMREIQQLIEKVATPELKEAMRRLEEAMRQMDPNRLREALKDFQLNLEQINKNLDRTLALLKQLELEQKLDTMAKMAEKLAEQQDKINERLEQCNSADEMRQLQKPQEGQQQGLESIKEQMRKTAELNQEVQTIPQEEIDKAMAELNSEELKELLESMMQNLQRGNKSSCSSSGKKTRQKFGDLADLFKSMLQKTQTRQQQMIVRAIRKAIEDILYISQSQESLADSTRACSQRLGDHSRLASRQGELLDATGRTADKISELTKMTLFVNFATLQKLGDALRAMEKSIKDLGGRNPNLSLNEQIRAMSNLNQSARMLMKSQEQASACQSGTGMNEMMQQLSQLGQMQMQLNQQTQSLMPIPMGQAMNLIQQQQLDELAAQQEAIRKGLMELTDQYGDPDNVLGRLGELGEEMRRTAEQMRRQGVDENVVRRQERILSRLLDAQKSVNRRDYTQKRQARTGEDIIRRSPAPLSDEKTDADRLTEDINNALNEKYPRRYENQIKNYFRAISEDETLIEKGARNSAE